MSTSPPKERSLAATRSLVAFASGALARKRGKTLALGAALALTVAMAAAILFLTDSLRAAAARVRGAAPDLVVQRLVAGRPATLDATVAAELVRIEAVKSVEPRVWGYIFVPAIAANVVVIGDTREKAALDVASGALSEGRPLGGPSEAVLGASLARTLGLTVGDTLRLPPAGARAMPPLKIVGTFASSVEVYASDVMLVGESDARALFGLAKGDATDLAVTLTNPAEARVVAQAILEKVDGGRVVDRALMARTHELAFGRRSGLALAAILPALIALLILAWERLTNLGAEERREVAILKAVGFSTGDVITVKMAESLLVSLVATAGGIALAYAWVFLLGAPGLRAAIAGFGVLSGDVALVPEVDLAQLFGLTLGIVGPFVALSVLPAWRTAMVDPMDGMRG